MALGEGTMWGIESLFGYNGLVMNDLRNEEAYIFDTINGLRGAELREVREVIASDDGEQLVGDPLLGGKTISIAGRVRAGSAFRMRYMQENLHKAFASRVELPLTIYSDPNFQYQNSDPLATPNGDSPGWNWVGEPGNSLSTAMVPVQIMCKKSTEIDMDDSQENFKAERDFQITLRATNPRIVSQTEKQKTITPANGATTVTGTVRNLGGSPAQARIRVTGPTGSNPIVENLTTGQTEKFLGTWAAGTYIEAKTDGKRIYDNTGAIKRSAWDPTSKWITLEPGDNSIRLTLSAGAVSGVKLDVFHRDTWV